jgi:hypothetical protein
MEKSVLRTLRMSSRLFGRLNVYYMSCGTSVWCQNFTVQRRPSDSHCTASYLHPGQVAYGLLNARNRFVVVSFDQPVW